jgi:hypothetical protein
MVDKITVKSNAFFDKSFNIPYPLRIWKTSSCSGFTMGKDGIGRYCGPNQMFGGPNGGDLVLFDNLRGVKPYYAVIVRTTQGWHSRTGDLNFLTFSNKMYSVIKESIIDSFSKRKITHKEVWDMSYKIGGFKMATDISSEVAKIDLHNYINSI